MHGDLWLKLQFERLLRMILRPRMLPLILLLTISSCGSPERDHWTANRLLTFPASGIVKLDGEPVENAIILFQSEDHQISARGRSDASGRFRLTTYEENDGAVSGQHLIVVKKVEQQITLHPEGDLYPPMVNEIWIIPERYGDPKTSEL